MPYRYDENDYSAGLGNRLLILANYILNHSKVSASQSGRILKLLGYSETKKTSHAELPIYPSSNLHDKLVGSLLPLLELEQTGIANKWLPVVRNAVTGLSHVVIHVRGTDIVSADGEYGIEISDMSYYGPVIDQIVETEKNPVFTVVSDDKDFSLVHQINEYLTKRKARQSFQLRTKRWLLSALHGKMYADWISLLSADIIVMNTSTFPLSTLLFHQKRLRRVFISLDQLNRFEKRINKMESQQKRSQEEIFLQFWKELPHKTNKEEIRILLF